MPFLKIETLIELGRLNLDIGKYENTNYKANEVLKLITCTGFLLYGPEAELILAKAYFAQGKIAETKSFAKSAYEKANQIHYHLPKTKANHLLKTLPKSLTN